MMSTPGAVRSGLMAPSSVRPRLEKNATCSSRSTAPTVSAAATEPGEPIEAPDDPLLPAAITKSAPYCAVSVLTALLRGIVPRRVTAAEAHVDDARSLLGHDPLRARDDARRAAGGERAVLGHAQRTV